MKKQLTIEALITEVELFCIKNSGVYKDELFAITDVRLSAHLLNIFFNSSLRNSMI